MYLTYPSHEIITEIDGEKILKNIEAAGRTCYKSEDKITKDSSIKFVKMVTKLGHHSVIEHESISVRFVCDRGVSHELVRHRLCAFSQECVTGDTKIRKNLTIKDLYDRKNGTCYDRTHNKTIHLRSVDSNGNIIPNTFVDVFSKGIAKVFEVKTKLGYKIRCTKNHRFLTSSGEYKELKTLSPGKLVYVNGRPSLLKINDKILEDLYLYKKMSPSEISETFKVPYISVLTRLQKLNIFVKHLNDHNKEKYNKNHTKESYTKMKGKVLQQYKNGRIVWNKGLKEGDHPSVDIQAESLRKNHHNNQPGELNSRWAGGPQKHDKSRLLKEKVHYCELCEVKNIRLEVHHMDMDPTNNDDANLIKVCCACHNLLHHGWHVGKKSIKDEIISIIESGEEEVFDLQMADPYNNYIANGFITHNSTRYCNYKGGVEYIVPFWIKINKDDLIIKNDQIVDHKIKYGPAACWLDTMLSIERSYIELIDTGWTPQQARSVLPNSLKTELVVTCNIREWRHILNLRCSKKSHPQMVELMLPLLDELHELIPVLFDDLYELYIRK